MLNFKSIAFKIRASIILSIALCLFAVAIYYPSRQETLYRQNSDEKLLEMAKTVALGIDLAIEHQAFTGIESSIELATQVADFEFIAIIQEDSLGNPTIFAKNPSDYPDIKITERDTVLLTYFEYSFSFLPDFDGVILIASSRTQIEQEIADLNRPIYVYLGLISIFGLVISYTLANAITKPILRLSDTAGQLNLGNYDLDIPILTSGDEISQLNNTFSSLCVNLREAKQKNDQFNQFLESEIQRRTRDLEAVNDTLEQAQNVALMGHFELDHQSHVVFYSRSVLNILGMNEIENLKLGDLVNFMPRQDVSILIQYLGGAYENQPVFRRDIVFSVTDPSGVKHDKWLSVTIKPIMVEEHLKGFRGILQDITDRKKQEEEIYRLSLVAKNTSNAVIITDSTRKIVWANESATHITGYSLEEMMGNSPTMFQFEKTDLITIARIRESLNQSKPVRAEILNRGKKGNEYWLELNIVPLLGDDGEKLGYIAIETDITERKIREDEIGKLLLLSQHQNERLRNFAHIISHNLRSHSSNFSMLLDMMFMENPELKANDNIEQLELASKNLERTIHHLNEVVVINTTIADALTPINVFDVAERAILDVGALSRSVDVEISNHIDRDILIAGIPAYVESIFANLITNAIKYRSNTKNAYVKLRSEVNEDEVSIIVQDNGLGIDLEKHGEKLFGMYKTFHKHEDARGIGLFITKNQVESMGGQIHVMSTPNEGTTFIVKLNHATN